MNTVFISYSHVDSQTAEKLAETLRELRIEYFLDVKDIVWGDRITSKVHQSLRSCLAVVVVVSPASLKSHWVPYELGYAAALEKAVLPFLVHPSLEVPHYIRDITYATDIRAAREYFQKIFPQLREAGNPADLGTASLSARLPPEEEDVLRAIHSSEESFVRAEILAKVLGVPERRVNECLKRLRAMQLLKELNGSWQGTYELLEQGQQYLQKNGLV